MVEYLAGSVGIDIYPNTRVLAKNSAVSSPGTPMTISMFV